MFKYIFYVIPFIFFIGGYYTLSRLIVISDIETPALIGESLETAVIKCSEHKLILHIMSLQERVDIVPGTIIQQIPSSGVLVKPGQKIFIVVVKSPQRINAFQCTGKDIDEVRKEAKEREIHVKEYEIIDYAYPTGMVIAQMPQPGTPLDRNKEIIVYKNRLSSSVPYLMPDLIGLTAEEVQQWCNETNIECDIIYQNYYPRIKREHSFVVQAQTPLAGSFIMLDKKLKIQVSIAASV